MKFYTSMCQKALLHKDANVNIILDFILDLTTTIPLFVGHKPTSSMIDTRTQKHFEKFKALKDKNTLKLDIYSTLPLL